MFFKKIKKKIIRNQVFILFFYILIRLYLLTIRVKIRNEDFFLEQIKDGKVILCTFHQQFCVLLKVFNKYRKYNPSFITSQSDDGNLTAQFAKQVGWHPIRGSSSKGGASALFQTIKHLKKAQLVLHIVDGPRGPIGCVKPGLVSMAKFSGAVVVPFYVMPTKDDGAWFLNNWDKFMIPKPFSQVELFFEKAIKINKDSNNKELERARVKIEKEMGKYLISNK